MKDIFREIYARQKLALIIPESAGEEVSVRQKQLAMTVAANFAAYNMIMSADMIDELSHASESDIVSFYNFYNPILKDMIGADFSGRRLFYPGFPEEVIGKDRFEIFLDQVIYAYTGLSMMPEEKPDMTYFPYIGDGHEKKLITGTEEGFEEYLKGLFKREVLWTPTEKEVVETVVENKANFLNYYPEEPSKIKENNIHLLNLIKKKEEERFMFYATKYLKTPTDVLRYAVTLVGGNPALNGKMLEQVQTKGNWYYPSVSKDVGFSFSKNPRYPEVTRNLKKSEIKEVLALLSNTRMDIGGDYPELLEQIKENAKRDGRNTDVVLVDDAVQTYSSYYKSLAKVAHLDPNKNNQVNKVLGAICSNKTVTIHSLIERAIDEKNVEDALKYLKYRPTELGRRMDKLCEIAVETGKQNIVLDEYRKTAAKSSISNLLQMYGTFEARKFLQDERIITVDGQTTVKPPKAPLNKNLCNAIQEIVEDALKEKFKDTPYKGKFYIDPSMAKVKVPKNNRLRDASETLYPYTFGSSLPASNTTTKQFAIKWEDGNIDDSTERVDLDLSSTLVDKNGKTTHIGWNSHYSVSDMVVYSGDIQEGGSAEFINCDLDKLREAGIAGVVPSVNIYCGAKNFSELLDVQMVMAERNDMDYGATYEAKSVRMSLTPKSTARQINPMVLNVKTGEWIWLDSLVENKNAAVASTNLQSLANLIKEALFVNEYNPGFDILLRAQNCEVVNKIEDADFVFTQEAIDESLLKDGAQNITQTDYDRLVEYLSVEKDEIAIDTPTVEGEIR